MDQDYEQNKTAPAPAPAEQLLAMLRSAAAAVFIETNAAGELVIRAIAPTGVFNPGQNAAHAFLAAIQSEHGHLLDVVNGRYTDALRFRALKEFAMLANVDPARFEVVNSALHQFEEKSGMAQENAKRTEADFVAIANFIVDALLETDQTEDDRERLAAAEEKRERKAGLRIVGANGQPLH